MSSKTFKTTIVREGSMCYIPVPFDPAPVFGRVRAPVKVTLNGYTYRSTIFSMEGMVGIPLRKSNREGAGLEGGETPRSTAGARRRETRSRAPCRFRESTPRRAAGLGPLARAQLLASTRIRRSGHRSEEAGDAYTPDRDLGEGDCSAAGEETLSKHRYFGVR